jgi:hypothetical protein
MGAVLGDITSPRLLVLKGGLMLVAGVLASVMLVLESSRLAWWGVLGLHGAAVWAFCRAYYFAFYVIEKYIDPGSRYAGLAGAAVRAWRVMRSGRQ